MREKIKLQSQCWKCGQMAPAEAVVIDPRDGKYPEIDWPTILDHNNPQGHLCDGSRKHCATSSNWLYKANRKTRKAFSAECHGCHRHVQCVGRLFMIPMHLDEKEYRCKGSLYFPNFEELTEIPD